MQTCTGRFVNPISDICWECLFPISIGPIAIGSAMGAPDTPNPSSPICLCGSPIPRIGLSVGVWEPARLLDVTRTPWCFPNLGGLTINPGLHAARGRTGSSGGDGAAGSVWHAHLYMYPLLSWIGALLDLGCLEAGGLDIAWTSELDPAWLDDELSFLLNPEAALFANLPAQAACAADCAASSTGLPLDPLFWCAGCQGGMYPLTGNVTAHVGGVQASLLTAQRLLYWLHRAGLAWGTAGSGALCGRYAVEKTHANGRFEVARVPRGVIVAFSTRQTEIETAMAERGLWRPADHPRIAKRVALFTRPAKRVADRSALRGAWERRAADLGFDARALVAEAEGKVMAPDPRTFMAAAPGQVPARDAAAAPVAWATAHLSERGAVFKRAELLAGALAYAPGTVTMAAVEREVAAREEAGTLHAVSLPSARDSLAIDRAAGEERETAALMRSSRARGQAVMRALAAEGQLDKGPLTAAQKEAVKLILSAKESVVGVQGDVGAGKTAMLDRARALAEKKGWRLAGLAPSASAAKPLAAAGIVSESLPRFLARHAGAAEGRLTKSGAQEMRDRLKKTILVVDAGTLVKTVQARDLLRVAHRLQAPRVVLVGDANSYHPVDAGKPLALLRAAGMQTADLGASMRRRHPELGLAPVTRRADEIMRAFAVLGSRVAEVQAGTLADSVAARWLALSPEDRERTGVLAQGDELRREINCRIREGLAGEGRLRGPALEIERLVSKDYTLAEKSLASSYAAGDVVAFRAPDKRLGVESGEVRRVVGVDPKSPGGATAGQGRWEPRLESRADQRPDRRHRDLSG